MKLYVTSGLGFCFLESHTLPPWVNERILCGLPSSAGTQSPRIRHDREHVGFGHAAAT